MSKRLTLSIILVVAIVGGYYLYRLYRPASERLFLFRAWMNSPSAHPEWKLTAGSRCGEAPFIFPTDGMVGFLWDDSFRPGHRHQGLDIFGGNRCGRHACHRCLPRILDAPAGVEVIGHRAHPV